MDGAPNEGWCLFKTLKVGSSELQDVVKMKQFQGPSTDVEVVRKPVETKSVPRCKKVDHF